MYKLCKTEQSARRQRKLEEGLLRLMLLKPYEQISISQICDELQIPRKSFYRYFSGKEGALYGLIDHTLMEYESFAGPYQTVERRTLELDLQRFFLFWQKKKPLLEALERSGLETMLVDRSVHHALAEAGPIRRFMAGENEKTSGHVIMFSICGLMNMVLRWYRSGYEESPSQMARIACRLLCSPLFPNAESFF